MTQYCSREFRNLVLLFSWFVDSAAKKHNSCTFGKRN